MRRALTLVLGCLGAFFAVTGGAPAATINVDAKRGNDRSLGTAAAPVRTITRGVALAGSGDEVRVRSGVYRETVLVTKQANGVVIRAADGARPIVDGERKRKFGFDARGVSRVRIAGFEVRGQIVGGVYLYGTRNVVKGMNVHHVGSATQMASQGIKVVYGARNRVVGNVVHSIGPGSESMGIWLVQTKRNTVTRNVVYLVRKDGIRDWMSLGDRITSNRLFLNHNGISFNTTTGAYAANNMLTDNQVGFVAKHVSYGTVLAYWSLARARLTRFWHNSIANSSETGIWIGNSDEPLDHLSIANNVTQGGGLSFVRDQPTLRGPDVKVDDNLYLRSGSSPQSIYKEGWQREPAPVTDWAAYTSKLRWDAHGWIGNVGVTKLPTAGADRGDAFGRQLGAEGVPDAPVTWNPIAMTPVDSSSKGSWTTRKHLAEVADNDQTTYWITDTPANEFVTLDLHGRQTFNTLIASVYRHFDKRNVHGYRFEVSDDGKDWQTVAEGENPDTAGSSIKYELKEPVSARYLRYTMVDTGCTAYAPRTSCGPYFVISDIAAGLLSPTPTPAGTTSPEPQR